MLTKLPNFSNYAPTILISKMAGEMGCQQVLWLYDDDEKLTEVGTMNIFAYWINEQGGEWLRPFLCLYCC